MARAFLREYFKLRHHHCDRAIDAATAAALATPAHDFAALKAKAEILKAAIGPDGAESNEEICRLARALAVDVIALGETTGRP